MNVSGHFLHALNTLDPTLLFVNFQDNIVVSESESTPKPQEFQIHEKTITSTVVSTSASSF